MRVQIPFNIMSTIIEQVKPLKNNNISIITLYNDDKFTRISVGNNNQYLSTNTFENRSNCSGVKCSFSITKDVIVYINTIITSNKGSVLNIEYDISTNNIYVDEIPIILIRLNDYIINNIINVYKYYESIIQLSIFTDISDRNEIVQLKQSKITDNCYPMNIDGEILYISKGIFPLMKSDKVYSSIFKSDNISIISFITNGKKGKNYTIVKTLSI